MFMDALNALTTVVSYLSFLEFRKPRSLGILCSFRLKSLNVTRGWSFKAWVSYLPIAYTLSDPTMEESREEGNGKMFEQFSWL